MKPTDEQIEDAAIEYAENTIAVGDKDFLLEVGFTQGANWTISQMQPEWMSCAYDTPIQNGHYMFMLDNGYVMSEVYHAVKEDKVPYLYAIAYCKIYLPQPPTK